ncbi:uncharacterized protein LOC131623773 [Vicia villosa]|uniref:uncharacterized protein LOC131623773 n=1 Tax=Vicia villosa TaxID=3911 RepID=UPI00273C119F|nr:uncharacterized protein LOC131623773 [Vicia villosa]
MTGEDEIWKGMLQARYGNLRDRLWNFTDCCASPKDTMWWRDILEICRDPLGILNNLTEIGVNNGSVGSKGVWHPAGWRWRVKSGFEILGWEASEELEEPNMMLLGISPTANITDLVIWPFDSFKGFTVKPMYAILNQVSSEAGVEPRRNLGFRTISEASIPSKLKFFDWRPLLDRLPTRKQLFRRGVILLQQEARCAFCLSEQENFNHFLLFCPLLKTLWIKLQGWLHFDLEEDVEDCLRFQLTWKARTAGNPTRGRLGPLWLTIFWAIWKHRNDILFNNSVVDTDEIFFMTMWYSWWWLAIVSKDIIRCNLFEWIQNSFLCSQLLVGVWRWVCFL